MRDEFARLGALNELAIMDTPFQRDFDEITRLAALALDAGSSAVSLVDDRRAWFKARYCVAATEVPREHAFCAVALASAAPTVILDTQADARFADNPLTRGDGAIRFYAGAPLIMASGHCVGTLCVLDTRPRTMIEPAQIDALTGLSRIVVELIEARRHRAIGEIAVQVVEVTSDAIVCADDDGRITFWNRAAERMFGHAAADALGRGIDIIVPPALVPAHEAGFARAASGGTTHLVGTAVELTAIHADGHEFPVELSLARWGSIETGYGFAGIVRDASIRKMLEREREQAKAFLNTVVDNLPAMLFVKDVASREYLLINRAGEALTGRSSAEIVGRRDIDLFPGGVGYEARDDAAVANEGVAVFESDFTDPAGKTTNLRTKRIVVPGPDHERQYILGMSEDVTEIRQAQAEVLRLAHYDSLTGLHNRAFYLDRLGALIAATRPFALLSVDLDRFKSVNDQHGHLTGDEALAEVAERLRAVAGSHDLIARVGGDEFVFVVAGGDAGVRAGRIAGGIVDALDVPIVTARAPVHLGASIGVALFPDDASGADDLRQCADLALYRAKDQGRGSVCFFSAEMDAAARDRRQLEHDLRNAIDAGQISLAFQPVVAAATGRITSCEALARWHHPTRGPIPPDVFISVAEESGLIETLGTHILTMACREAVGWPGGVRIAINVSPVQIHTGDLCRTVKHVLADTGLRPERLQIEVTESLFLKGVDQTFDELEQLRGLGVQILMDDFGIGYSSLSYFERFTFDKVKIDQSFVRQMPTSRASAAVIRAVVGLGSSLGIGIVAEGVETDAQRRTLVDMGCTHLQGYLFSRPVDASAIARLLADNGALPHDGAEPVA